MPTHNQFFVYEAITNIGWGLKISQVNAGLLNALIGKDTERWNLHEIPNIKSVDIALRLCCAPGIRRNERRSGE